MNARSIRPRVRRSRAPENPQKDPKRKDATMNRLNGTDASFLYAETARMHMHIGSVQLIDVPNDRHATFFDDVKALYRARADRLRYIDHRLTQAPLQLDHPRWTACDVDFDEHL